MAELFSRQHWQPGAVDCEPKAQSSELRREKHRSASKGNAVETEPPGNEQGPPGRAEGLLEPGFCSTLDKNDCKGLAWSFLAPGDNW